jgi:acetyl-CoA acetyltransferase
MERAAAKNAGYSELCEIVDTVFVGVDPARKSRVFCLPACSRVLIQVDELLLGPAKAVAEILRRNKLKASDVKVWELHEAFAGQVLANINALKSDRFGVGALPMDGVNSWGGSLSIGHPFAATSVRLLATAAHRMEHEKQEIAVVAACAAGGLGVAHIVKRAKQ